MGKRKLFYALNRENNKVHINDSKQDNEYLCPFCKQEVIPKKGTEKTWHFAHKDKPCAHLKSNDDGNNAALSWFATDFTEEIDFSINPNKFQCKICKEISPKELGVKWKEDEYFCKGCYRQL